MIFSASVETRNAMRCADGFGSLENIESNMCASLYCNKTRSRTFIDAASRL